MSTSMNYVTADPRFLQYQSHLLSLTRTPLANGRERVSAFIEIVFIGPQGEPYIRVALGEVGIVTEKYGDVHKNDSPDRFAKQDPSSCADQRGGGMDPSEGYQADGEGSEGPSRKKARRTSKEGGQVASVATRPGTPFGGGVAPGDRRGDGYDGCPGCPVCPRDGARWGRADGVPSQSSSSSGAASQRPSVHRKVEPVVGELSRGEEVAAQREGDAVRAAVLAAGGAGQSSWYLPQGDATPSDAECWANWDD